jgi:hypothetical protein
VVVIGPAAERGTADIGFATDALRGLNLYKGITGRDPRR